MNLSRRVLLFSAILLLVGASCHNGSVSPTKPQPTTVASATSSPKADLDKLLAEIHEANGDDHRMYSWLMNSEHLFIGINEDESGEHSLRVRTIAFSRMPGRLVQLFERLQDPGTSTEDAFKCVEILVYFGQYDQDGDEKIVCKKKLDASFVDSLQMRTMQASYLDAPIARVLRWSAEKASKLPSN